MDLQTKRAELARYRAAIAAMDSGRKLDDALTAMRKQVKYRLWHELGVMKDINWMVNFTPATRNAIVINPTWGTQPRDVDFDTVLAHPTANMYLVNIMEATIREAKDYMGITLVVEVIVQADVPREYIHTLRDIGKVTIAPPYTSGGGEVLTC